MVDCGACRGGHVTSSDRGYNTTTGNFGARDSWTKLVSPTHTAKRCCSGAFLNKSVTYQHSYGRRCFLNKSVTYQHSYGRSRSTSVRVARACLGTPPKHFGFVFAWCEYLARQGQGPCTLAFRASQTFVYRGLTGRVINVIIVIDKT